MASIIQEFRALLPALAFALVLPIPAITFWEDGAGRAYAYAYLFLGCAIMAAESFTVGSSSGSPDAIELPRAERRAVWLAKMSALSIAVLCAVAVFTLAWFALSDTVDHRVPSLALLTVLPALGGVPYFTLKTRKLFLGVLFATLLLCSIKILGCVVVRMVYGPDALAQGYMAMDWRRPNLLVVLCAVGALVYSMVLYGFGSRRFQQPEVSRGK